MFITKPTYISKPSIYLYRYIYMTMCRHVRKYEYILGYQDISMISV